MAVLYVPDTIASLEMYSGKYQEQLRREHYQSSWGSTGAKYSGSDILFLLRERPYIKSVLDYGAGKASMGSFIEELMPGRVQWTNYDIGIPEYDQLPSKTFDLVLSTDVLEHVEPDRLSSVLQQLEQLTGKVLYSDIACYPTGKFFGEGPYIGEDFHLIIESPSWWRDQFKQLSLQEFEYRATEKLSKGKMKIRCMMIHEKV